MKKSIDNVSHYLEEVSIINDLKLLKKWLTGYQYKWLTGYQYKQKIIDSQPISLAMVEIFNDINNLSKKERENFHSKYEVYYNLWERLKNENKSNLLEKKDAEWIALIIKIIEDISKEEFLQLLERSNISEKELRMSKERLLSIKLDNKDTDWNNYVTILKTLDEFSSLKIIREMFTIGYDQWEEIFELSNKWDENGKIFLIYEVISAGCKDYKLLKKEIGSIKNVKDKKELLLYLEKIKLYDKDYSENREKFPTIIGKPYEIMTLRQIVTVFPATFNGLKEVHKYLTNNPKINSVVFYHLRSKLDYGKVEPEFSIKSYEDVLNELVDNEESIPGNQEEDVFNDTINLYVNIAYNSRITAKQAENYTQFLLSVIKKIKEQGYKVNIVGTTVLKMQDEIIDITINLNDKNQEKNIQELCKITSTPNFMKRIVFRIMETTKVVNYSWFYTYGTPLDNKKLKEIKGLTDNDLYIPGPESLGIEGNNLEEDIEKANNNLDLDKYLNNDKKSPYKK